MISGEYWDGVADQLALNIAMYSSHSGLNMLLILSSCQDKILALTPSLTGILTDFVLLRTMAEEMIMVIRRKNNV